MALVYTMYMAKSPWTCRSIKAVQGCAIFKISVQLSAHTLPSSTNRDWDQLLWLSKFVMTWNYYIVTKNEMFLLEAGA